jgi:hypothetical protein
VNQRDDLPDSIVLERNRDLAGRAYEPWFRRAGLLVLVVLVTIALANVVGQRPHTSSADSPAATLELEAPKHLRGGLLFQAKITVHALREIREPELVLDPGWFDSFTVNTIEPSPSEERTDNGRTVLQYDLIPAGRNLIVWIEFQVNPTNVGKYDQDVELYDGDTKLVHLDHSVRVYP